MLKLNQQDFMDLLTETQQNGGLETLDKVALKDVTLKDEVGLIFSFHNSRFTNSHFTACNFSNVILRTSQFENCSFVQCTFNKGSLVRSVFSGTKFSNSTFRRSLLMDCDLRYADFTHCDFAGARILTADMRYAALEGATFESAILNEVKVYGCGKNEFGPNALLNTVLMALDISPDGDGSEMVKDEEACAYLEALTW